MWSAVNPSSGDPHRGVNLEKQNPLISLQSICCKYCLAESIQDVSKQKQGGDDQPESFPDQLNYSSGSFSLFQAVL